MIRLGTFASNMTPGRRAAIATAITGVTAAEVAALADLLTILASRPDLLQPALRLSSLAKFDLNLG